MAELKGIITPTITPISKGDLDYDAVDSMMDFLHSAGVSGIFPMGSTGAFAITSVELQVKILEYFMDKKKENMYFLAGVGRNSFDETLTMGNYARELGADGLSIVTPYYVSMSQDSLYSYYDRLLQELDIPILIYNIPQNTNNNITAETVLKLRNEHNNLVGIKDSSSNFTNFSRFIDVLGKDFAIFQGQDDLLLPSLMMGASGGICGTSNFSDLSVKVYSEFKSGNINNAIEIQKKLSFLKKTIGKYEFPQSYVAAFSGLVYGKDLQSIFPLRDLDKEMKEKLISEIKSIM